MLNLSTPDSGITIYSQNHTDFGNGTDAITFVGMEPTSKPYFCWISYDSNSSSYRITGCMGCHYNLTSGSTHSHCSWETLDNSTGIPSVNSHFEISYMANQTRAAVKFPSSDVQYISNQKVYFGDTLSQAWIVHNGTTGDIMIHGNANLFLDTSQLNVNGKNIINVTDIFSNNDNIDLKSANATRIFPWGQTTLALSIANNTANLTLDALGTTWIQFTDNFLMPSTGIITQNISAVNGYYTGNVTVAGNITGNVIYGEMWNFTSAGFAVAIPVISTYYQVTGLACGSLNGFTCSGSNLTVRVPGTYRIDSTLSISGSANSQYGVGIRINSDNPETLGKCYTRFDGESRHETVSSACFRTLAIGDTVGMWVDDQANPPQNIDIHTVGITLTRVGT